ncbi:hypothetical protein BSKO_05838 [Bryopsis sp. KO-2023]|nr:hypothetical protein BSKO_05838 [Bryopsis sp. KO-2023]
MDDSRKTVAFFGGLSLGVVVATAVACLASKRYIEWLIEETRKENENGKTKKLRKRSASRSSSPTRRAHRHSTAHQNAGNFESLEEAEPSARQTSHHEAAGMHTMTMSHMGTASARGMSRGTPRAVSPRAPALLRTETTDDEAFGGMQRLSSDGRERDLNLSDATGAGSEAVIPHVTNVAELPAAASCALERMKTLQPIYTGHVQSHDMPPPKAASYAELGGVVSAIMDRGKAIEEAALVEDYCRVITPETQLTEEYEDVCLTVVECLTLREKWLFEVREDLKPENMKKSTEVARPSELHGKDPFQYIPLPKSDLEYTLVDGVFQVGKAPDDPNPKFCVPGTANDFFKDLHHMCKVSAFGPVKTFCHQRLMLLEQKFNLHVMMNADKEFFAQKSAPHRDFYNVRKVDTHVHHSACMHQKHLLRFIKSKLRKEPDEVVIFRDGKYLTLKEVFESLELTSYDLNVDTLDMHADKNIFHRFDKFNLKYNPCGQSRLREIFLKQDNLIHGRYLAELTKEVFDDLEASKYQHAEYRISIYGRKEVEWDILAAWICSNELSSDNVVWLIQIPRLYQVCKEGGILEDFEQMLSNIFTPLFEVTKDPSTHPQLHMFLQQVVGFDMVDDESRPERRPSKHMPTAKEWNNDNNPPYSYYAYYMYANIYVLNKFRESRGLNTFVFRPHSGEAGDIDHLVCAFMLCGNIAHGINLRRSPFMQYLFYLAQVGLCMSPLSNNSLFLDYHKNPFPIFFARGLNVSLSTDDPLQIHLTKEPLVEEYSIAAQVWKLSSTDLCEIARNGVLHSGFPDACKRHWIAQQFWRSGPEGNDIQRTNVPNLRLRFRHDTHRDEFQLILVGCANCRIRQERSSDADV